MTEIPSLRGSVDAQSSAKVPDSRQRLIDAMAATAVGDRAAFEILYAATCKKLYGIVVRIVGRRDVADDVLQDVYVRIWLRAGEFDPVCSSPITWLAAIARNRALDEAKRKTMRSLEECPQLQDLPSDDDPRARLEQEEEWRRLRAGLNRLEPEKRQIVLLAYAYGMTREEIASRVGRPIPTVKTWLRCSLAQLRLHLDD